MGKYGNVIDCDFPNESERMSLETKQVRNVAWLARLAITEDAEAGYAEDMTTILALAAQLQAVDTAALEPLAHPLELVTPRRADRVLEADRRADFQRHAPLTQDGYYLVPKFVE